MDRISIAIWGFAAFMFGMALGVVFIMDKAALSREFLQYANYFSLTGAMAVMVVSIRQMRANVRKKIEEQSNG